MKNWGHIVNCRHHNKLWDYENIRWGTRACNWDFFIKTKSYKLGWRIINERVNREITNFHPLHWCTMKVVEKWQFVPEAPFSILYNDNNNNNNNNNKINKINDIQSNLL